SPVGVRAANAPCAGAQGGPCPRDVPPVEDAAELPQAPRRAGARRGRARSRERGMDGRRRHGRRSLHAHGAEARARGGAVTWTALFIGLAGGFTSGLLGIGGGVVLVPLMLRFLRLPQSHAHGTSLAILVVTATAAALTYGAA